MIDIPLWQLLLAATLTGLAASFLTVLLCLSVFVAAVKQQAETQAPTGNYGEPLTNYKPPRAVVLPFETKRGPYGN